MTLAADVSATFRATGSTPFSIDVDLAVETGETLVVLGPSGAGKTLLLETIAGYHDHRGTVYSGGVEVTDAPPEARHFGFVFQDYGLFPHRTVRENVAFGTRYHEDHRDPDELLRELGVAELTNRQPGTLSGGEAQRVALARSLAIRPSALLLDEPLSSLDVPTRERLRDDLSTLINDVTAVYVTHNRTTARVLGDRIAVMRRGRIVQTGPPATVFDRPATPFVARFTGSNCLEVTEWIGRAAGVDPEASAHLAIRPEHVIIGDGGPTATVERIIREDAGYRLTLSVGAVSVTAFSATAPDVGDSVPIAFPESHVTLLD